MVILEVAMAWCECGRFAELDDNRHCSNCRDADTSETARHDSEDR